MYSRRGSAVVDRIATHASVGVNGCWAWTGTTNNEGYGSLRIAGRMVLAHRASYEAFIGTISSGLVIDHLCRNAGCVNPTHLEPVTNRTNILRGAGITARQAKQTHCKRGHAFDGDNLYRWRGGRMCKACRAALQRINGSRLESGR